MFSDTMDNRINEIRSKITALRIEMGRVEGAMHDQIQHDLDSTESALRLMTMRTQLAGLVAEWKAAGGSEPLPTLQERFKAGSPAARRERPSRRGWRMTVT
jgi:chorismate mutase